MKQTHLRKRFTQPKRQHEESRDDCHGEIITCSIGKNLINNRSGAAWRRVRCRRVAQSDMLWRWHRRSVS